MATYMHYSMHILSVLLDFKMKKHLLSTGSQNSIITITIEENAMEELVWINKLLPRGFISTSGDSRVQMTGTETTPHHSEHMKVSLLFASQSFENNLHFNLASQLTSTANVT